MKRFVVLARSGQEVVCPSDAHFNWLCFFFTIIWSLATRTYSVLWWWLVANAGLFVYTFVFTLAFPESVAGLTVLGQFGMVICSVVLAARANEMRTMAHVDRGWRIETYLTAPTKEAALTMRAQGNASND